MKLQDKRVLLTGATGGIGSALAHQLAEAGAQVVLCGRQLESLEALRVTLPHPQKHISCCFDVAVSSPETIFEAINACGAVDILINNAGCGYFSWLENQSVENITQQINTNLVAPILLTKTLLPIMKRPGMIVNIGSCLGAIGYPGYSIYSATKFGLRGFSESLARELCTEELSVIYIAPRATATDFNDSIVNEFNKTIGNAVDSPDVVARHVIKCIINEKSTSTIGFPESVFVKINAIFPSIVTSAITGKINTIKQFALKSKKV
jgi:short-subunit dehydrogenase